MTTVDVVVPVYNEERALPKSIPVLGVPRGPNFPYDWRIIIGDNASIDDTPAVGRELADKSRRAESSTCASSARGAATH